MAHARQEMTCTVCQKDQIVHSRGERALGACNNCLRVTEFVK